MERDCESELSKLNIEQNACIYHFGASVIHGQRSNILRLRNIDNIHALNLYKNKGFKETGVMDEDEIELSLMLY